MADPVATDETAESFISDESMDATLSDAASESDDLANSDGSSEDMQNESFPTLIEPNGSRWLRIPRPRSQF